MLPVNRFVSFVEQHCRLNRADKILLAVSGGKDSVLMAHLFNEAKFNFGIAHCNFGLRAEEADHDENFCKELAEKLRVPFHSIAFDTLAFAQENKISIQMAARELRYSWFEQIRSTENYSSIALAHHKNDTVETVILNLVRGTGISGMHGILPKRNKLVRPLLFLERAEIDQLILENHISYREDSSNKSTKYARNKIRHDVIPKLKELNPDLESTFERNSFRFKQLEELLSGTVNELKGQLFKVQHSNEIHIELQKIQKLQPLNLLLFELFKEFGFSETVLADLISSWSGQPGKIFESAGYILLLDRQQLILSKKKSAILQNELINQGVEKISLGDFDYGISEVAADECQIERGKEKAYFDADLLHFPLKLRHWEEGDYFYPIGMKGKKKVSDYFTSLKISRTDKQRIAILENGNGDILWICGYRPDDRYKINSQTKKVVIFEQQSRR